MLQPSGSKQQLHVVQLSPTTVFGAGRLSPGDASEKLPSKQPSDSECLSRQCSQSYLGCIRRGRAEKRQKERWTQLERGFDLCDSRARTQSDAFARPQRAKQLSSLARKIHQECRSEMEGETARISELVKSAASSSTTANHFVGDEVEVRDRDMMNWRDGIVTSVFPLKVTLPEWDQAFQWDFVRQRQTALRQPSVGHAQVRHGVKAGLPAVSPEVFCICGNAFQHDAMFCSRCGRRRGCEMLANTVEALKPPRAAPRQGSTMQRSASDFSNWLLQQRSAKPPQSLDLLKTVTPPASRGIQRSVEANTSFVSSGKACPHWQQLTVPILAENGDVVEVRPAGENAHGVWQQNTVPIVGEYGEVIALRPPACDGSTRKWRQLSMPIFNELGDIIAVPRGDKCDWQMGTVPILGENGEVIALRPPLGDERLWKPNVLPMFGSTGEIVAFCPIIGSLRQWEQMTVPILCEGGEVITARPLVERDDKSLRSAICTPGWARRGPGCLSAFSVSDSILSDRTYLLPSQMRTKFENVHLDGTSSCEPENGRRAFSHGAPKRADAGVRKTSGEKERAVFLTELVPETDGRNGGPGLDSGLGDTFRGLADVCGTLNDRVTALSNTFDLSLSQGRSGKTDTQCKSNAGVPMILQELCAPELDLSRPCSAVPSSAPSSPRSIMTSASVRSADSMESLRAILHICNNAKQATPEGHMLNVLKEALVSSPGDSGTCTPNLMLLSGLEARELVSRLGQLPELWRTTILRLIEEAETVQVNSDRNGLR